MSTDKNKQYNQTELWGGMECTINRVGNLYFDQLHYSDYYNKDYKEDISKLGLKKLRFPILWEKHEPVQKMEIDWEWTSNQLYFFKEKQIDIIAGLVHHGSGPAFTNLLDPDFPVLLANYAKKVAKQFPWIKFYTPVNEPLTTARFSGLYSLWYPHKKTDKNFLLMLLYQLKGVVLSMQEIRKINPQASLIQTEDLGKTYSTKKLNYQARFENERRWLTFDLLCGRVNEKHKLWKYFKRFNIPAEQLHFFLDNRCEPDIFGFNHYVTSERYLDENTHNYPNDKWGGNKRHRYADVEVARMDIEEETGLKVLLLEAWQRYKAPFAITEVHLHCHREEQLRWFKYVWKACESLKDSGINIQAVTAWALLGSYGWDELLTQPKGSYEPGVFDQRGGNLRSTALSNFIKHISITNNCEHELANIKGWWQRKSRLIYVPPQGLLESVEYNNAKRYNPILIIGKNGTLGRAFAKLCNQRALPYILLSRNECDIAEEKDVIAAIETYKPWAIINAAGYVRIDDAEREQEQCFRENVTGVENLARASQHYGVKLITFSSDLVFNGSKEGEYLESDQTDPLNIYGKTKALAEQIVLKENNNALIIRTSAFFGPWDEYNFVYWVKNNLENELAIPVANDVWISATYVPDLVHATLDLLIDGENGLWHVANVGRTTWWELACMTAHLFKLDTNYIQSSPLADLNLSAQRPLNSVLGSERAILLPPLNKSLQKYKEELKSSSTTKDHTSRARISA